MMVRPIVKWIQTCMQEGIRPQRGFYGEDMKGRAKNFGAVPMRCFLAGLKSDASQRKSMHQFRNCAQSTYVCDQCCAHKSKTLDQRLHYSDASDHALWKQTLITQKSYLSNTDLEDLSPWICLPGYSTRRVVHVVLLSDRLF